MSAHVPRGRMAALGLVVAIMFSVLGVRLYDLQVVATHEYQVQAEANRVREVPVEAPRGRILDRHGEVVVDNQIASVVSIDRNEFRDLDDEARDRLLFLLVGELNRDGVEATVDGILDRLDDPRFSPYAPVPVARDVSEELRVFLAERSSEFPSVRAERTALRHYPHGSLASSLLGYVGSVTEAEMEELEDVEDKPYDLNDQIGKAGLELAFEEHLRGTPGVQHIEVDAEGTPVRVIDEVLPQPGSDVYLSIDINLQREAEEQLQAGLQAARETPPRAGRPPNKGTRGAVVIQNPADGDVLAMASYPTYDPREFVDGISQDQWAYLNDPANHYPLNNWAIQGQWAPGSTFKLFTGYAGLAGGVVSGDSTYSDSGAYAIPGCTQEPCSVSNSGGTVHGAIAMRQAMTVSSNAYFANIGGEFWQQRGHVGGEEAIQGHMEMLGLGERTGIDLAYEVPGRLPSSIWAQEYCDELGDPTCDPSWGPGHNAHMAIGQGSVLVTPLQLSNGYAVVANGGTLYRPQIVDRIEPPEGDPIVMEPDVQHEAPMPPHVRDPLHDGLVGVTAGGTASGAFAGFPLDTWPVAGKTGTGEFEHRANTATFVSYGPADDPQYSMSVVMEESDFGGSAAAPVARSLYDILAHNAPVVDEPLGDDPLVPEVDEEDDESGLVEVDGPVVD